MSHVFYIKSGDTAPSVEATLRNPGSAQGLPGPAIDLTAATGVRFLMEGGLAEDAVIVDALTGQVRYDWSAGETDTPGTHDAEFEITWGDGRIQTVPNGEYIKVVIAADLG